MDKYIILKKNPKIEIHILEEGYKLIDRQTQQNTGFYNYSDMRSVKLNNVWFLKLAKWLRVITWILNGVPYFPDSSSCKKANIIIHFRNTKIGIWLTDTAMANRAKRIKEILEEKNTKCMPI